MWLSSTEKTQIDAILVAFTELNSFWPEFNFAGCHKKGPTLLVSA